VGEHYRRSARRHPRPACPRLAGLLRPARRNVEAAFRFDPEVPATDHDRACDAPGWLGVIPVGIRRAAHGPGPAAVGQLDTQQLHQQNVASPRLDAVQEVLQGGVAPSGPFLFKRSAGRLDLAHHLGH
jgi:hypothetical protein